jgi:hypothetical protein
VVTDRKLGETNHRKNIHQRQRPCGRCRSNRRGRSVSSITKYRTDLVSEFYKEAPTISQLDLALKYYGLQNTRGVTDEKFYSNVEALYKRTDDCIFFSKILADDLFEYERRLRRRYGWRFRLRVPKLVREKWNFPETRRLLPNENNYADWLRGLPKVPSRFTRLRKWLLSGNGAKPGP